ncbi:CAMK family protein kinase [Tritrichomonas foetus]|uniref:CAMK family protein kinase n=1 Tax=Tritrichomonas foetus TaxID=1144522 RepID=A0A1J4KSP4_9EUKA|nr:CAMK family protein kinase [Tritrichomonas foetus]|eukprot:OHT12820.1 CAMK family protein kinase [Tritrichomonas foetus]
MKFFSISSIKFENFCINYSIILNQPENNKIKEQAMQEQTDYGVPLEVPLHFGHYRYLSTIGRGGSSVVVSCVDERTTQIFAGKITSRRSVMDLGQMEYLERELRLQSSLNHPNLLRIIDVIYTKELIIVITEFCENGDLITFITTNSFLMLSLAKKIFTQIVEGLNYLHQRKIAHRDLKPDNIFLDQDLNVKIGDFGLAKSSVKGELFNTLCGTFYYLAPEIIKHEDYDGMKCDIWALGIILYSMIFGTLPWRSTNHQQLIEEICRADLAWPSDINVEASDIIRRCTMIDPQERPTTEEILNMPWVTSRKIITQNSNMLGNSVVFGNKGNVNMSSPIHGNKNTLAAAIRVSPSTRNKRMFSSACKNILSQPIRSSMSEKRKSGQFLLNINSLSATAGNAQSHRANEFPTGK